MSSDTSNPYAPAGDGANHHANLAALIEKAASALQEISVYWEVNDLPGDFTTPQTGFPFAVSLEDQCAGVWMWAEAMRKQAAGEPVRDPQCKGGHACLCPVAPRCEPTAQVAAR